MASLLLRRHIQEADNNTTFVYHWGYGNRDVPCTSDAESCAYLDAVYVCCSLGFFKVEACYLLGQSLPDTNNSQWMHDVSMLYTFIVWVRITRFLNLHVPRS